MTAPEDIFLNHYECCDEACGHRWSQSVSRGEPHPSKCPLSTETWKHLYFKWLNYSEDLIVKRKVASISGRTGA